MAGQNTGFQMAYKIEGASAGIPQYTIVKRGTADGTCTPGTANCVPLGVVCNDERVVS